MNALDELTIECEFYAAMHELAVLAWRLPVGGENRGVENFPPAGAADDDRVPGVRRDRDADGRARNARPRDALGRPLPHGAPGIPTMPEDVVLPPAEALAEAQRLLDAGRPFHAHEVLEAAWKAAPDDERELWRGLAQLAVGLTHARRGNPTGAVRLLLRAADRIESYAEAAPHGVPVSALVAWTRQVVAGIERDGLATMAKTAPTPRLTGETA